MKNIIISQPKTDSLINQIVAFYQIFSKIKQNEKVNFDLTNLNWIYPFLILPVSAYIRKSDSEYIPPLDDNVLSYLNIINFPGGVNSVSAFNKFSNYIPISLLKNKDSAGREQLETLFSKMVYKTLKSVPGTENAVYLPIAELVTNIFEHSGENEGWIFAQLYPKKKFLDLCILDCGRGLSKTYLQEKSLKISDLEAVKLAMTGHSVKSGIERGYGIRCSKKVICDGFGGDFVIISGDAGLFSINGEEKLVQFPSLKWQGVIIVYRIPQPKKAIDINSYLE